MLHKYLLLSVIAVLMLYSCTKDRVDTLDKKNSNPPITADSGNLTKGSLIINELLSKGQGTDPDWFEIYNPNSYTVVVDSGVLFASDDFNNTTKNLLPAYSFPPKSFTQIICGGQAGVIVNGFINVSFNFSSSGEQIALFTKDTSGSFIFIDSTSFGSIPDGESWGRIPDGSPNWQIISSPTPGSTNE